jgi:crotonobetaine/carnitine-CoA ligase
MSRNAVLAQTVPPYPVRRARIEAEPLPNNLGALLDESVEDAPDTVLLDLFESGEQLTYRDFRSRVNQLANGMSSVGISQGTHVGVMMLNTSSMPITWFALARLGAVMIPINTSYTARELEYVLRMGDASWLMVDEGCLATAGGVNRDVAAVAPGHIFVVGAKSAAHPSWESLAAGQSTELSSASPSASRLLNVQFTSGTTGFPKGVMLTQEYWLIIGKQAAFRDGRDYRRILASTPFFYMDPQWQLLMAIYQRGTLYLARKQSGSRFMKWVRENKIQFGLLPEIVFKQPEAPDDRDNEVVRMNVYGLSCNIHAALEERFDLIAREAYGMTEIGSGLSVPIEAVEMVGSGSCGIPSAFREVRIADERGENVPDGEVGELLVRGRGILLGYYNNPEATVAAFHGEWFRTGDLFRKDERGYFSIVGRVKDMIRRAGENVSAQEVEAVIVALDDVAEAAVLPVPDATRGEEVMACVFPRLPEVPAADLIPRLIEHCQRHLAPFKVPRYYRVTGPLPRTASFKIAKANLLADLPALAKGSFDRVDGTWIDG